ncbi:MAG: hypothetical protein AAF702_33870 [Chloroflexota bacterium]
MSIRYAMDSHAMDSYAMEPNAEVIASIPALAAAIRQTHRLPPPLATTHLLFATPPSSFYQIQAKTLEAEARAVGHLVSEVAERLRRLAEAYGEWERFDPAAYFDLSEMQAEYLVQVIERMSTVYVVFRIDAFLPTFQQAESFWVQSFYPAYHTILTESNRIGFNGEHSEAESNISRPPSNGINLSDDMALNDLLSHGGNIKKNGLEDELDTAGMGGAHADRSSNESFIHSPEVDASTIDQYEIIETIHPQMVEKWMNLLHVVRMARKLLLEQIGYLAVNGSQEERSRWRHAWQEPPSRGIANDLCPPLQALPTLTLSIEFPLPAYRQPGRKQRLRIQRLSKSRRK